MIGSLDGIGGLSKVAFGCTRDCMEITEGHLQQGEPIDNKEATLDGKRNVTSLGDIGIGIWVGLLDIHNIWRPVFG